MGGWAGIGKMANGAMNSIAGGIGKGMAGGNATSGQMDQMKSGLLSFGLQKNQSSGSKNAAMQMGLTQGQSPDMQFYAEQAMRDAYGPMDFISMNRGYEQPIKRPIVPYGQRRRGLI